MPRLIPLTAAALALAVAVPVAAQDAELWSGPALTTTAMSEADTAVVDQVVEDVLSQSPDLPGLWIGVWDPDKGYYLQAYGEAVKGGEEAAVEQHGRIGSVTKTFTVTAILQQVAAGNLSLDSTISDVLPELAEQYPDIAEVTVEQLAGMRSPIQDYANTGVTVAQVIEDPQRVFSESDLIAAGMSLPLMDPEVGGYSTTNIIILGLMLEELTGQPAEQVVTEVAASLGMKDTALQPPEETLMPQPASNGYVEAPGRMSLEPLGLDIPAGTDVTDWTPSWGQAGGGMYSTIEDLGTWAGSGLGTSLLPVDVAAERFDFQAIPEGQYGLGLFDYDQGWVGHTGQLIGWESMVAYNTETGAAFVAIVNETGSLTSAEAVALQLFPDLIGILGL
ncbi:MAG: serine hydrolase domain-containing protein [Candidatus Limnocylindrales bacterium]